MPLAPCNDGLHTPKAEELETGFERIDDLLNGVTADGSLHGVAATVVGRDGVLYEGAPEMRSLTRCSATRR